MRRLMRCGGGGEGELDGAIRDGRARLTRIRRIDGGHCARRAMLRGLLLRLLPRGCRHAVAAAARISVTVHCMAQLLESASMCVPPGNAAFRWWEVALPARERLKAPLAMSVTKAAETPVETTVLRREMAVVPLLVLMHSSMASVPKAMTLMHRYTVKNAAARGALCNDGSPAAFYFRDPPARVARERVPTATRSDMQSCTAAAHGRSRKSVPWPLKVGMGCH